MPMYWDGAATLDVDWVADTYDRITDRDRRRALEHRSIRRERRLRTVA